MRRRLGTLEGEADTVWDLERRDLSVSSVFASAYRGLGGGPTIGSGRYIHKAVIFSPVPIPYTVIHA